MKEVFCQRCNMQIYRKEKAVSLNTCQEFPTVSDERWFHWHCFNEWLDEKVTSKAMNIYNKGMKQVMSKIKPIAEKMAKTIIDAKEETNKICEVGTC